MYYSFNKLRNDVCQYFTANFGLVILSESVSWFSVQISLDFGIVMQDA